MGLEENLRALAPKHEASKVVFGGAGAVKKFGRTSSLIDQVGGAFPDICAADEAVGRCCTRRLSN